MPLLSCGNCDGSLSNTKLILKLLGWLLRPSSWELCIYLSRCQCTRRGVFQWVWGVLMPCSKHRSSQSLRFHILPCTYVDHRSTVSYTCEIFSICASKVKSESEGHSVVSNSLQPHGCYSPWNSPGQNTGVGSLSLLQQIFLTQESNPGLLHCRWILYQLSYQGSPNSTIINNKDRQNVLKKSSQNYI